MIHKIVLLICTLIFLSGLTSINLGMYNYTIQRVSRDVNQNGYWGINGGVYCMTNSSNCFQLHSYVSQKTTENPIEKREKKSEDFLAKLNWKKELETENYLFNYTKLNFNAIDTCVNPDKILLNTLINNPFALKKVCKKLYCFCKNFDKIKSIKPKLNYTGFFIPHEIFLKNPEIYTKNNDFKKIFSEIDSCHQKNLNDH